MTTVTDSALARFKASVQNRSSMKLSLVGKTVDCTRYTWRPRTFSLTRTNKFPSEKRTTSPAPGWVPRYSQILRVSLGLPLPPKMTRSSSIVRHLIGARIFLVVEQPGFKDCARRGWGGGFLFAE